MTWARFVRRDRGVSQSTQDPAGAAHCDAQLLESVLPAGKDPDHFEVYADPSSRDVDLGNWEVPGAVLNTYEDVLRHCAGVAAAGACTDWRAQPLVDEGPVDGTTTADAGQGVTLSLTEQERDTGHPGLIPGRPEAGYDETVAWCRENLAACRTEAQENAADTAGAALAALRGIGVCTTRTALVELRRLIREIPGWAAATASVASQDQAAQAVGEFFGQLEQHDHNT